MQVKLYKEGLLPVFKTYNNPQWTRIKINIPPNGIVALFIIRPKFSKVFKLIFVIHLLKIASIILLLLILGLIKKIIL